MKVTNILLSTTAIAAGCVKASATPASHVAEPADVRPLPSVNRPVVGHRNGTRGVVAMAVEARDKQPVSQFVTRGSEDVGENELSDQDGSQEMEHED